ncbi:hypothetical protein M231_07444 [Tremella mesenterica]|uniref:Nuclear pore complex protein Nup205 n=1 Tax=Tremella mesenterica TaxID=5217 RepID=A0A4Q1BE62_TREME|nr:uncharacterized protein TREMEDRAFT_42231 [Tremella mesenterica DSM 1558]EIW73176.1 hypothetical protein TREMEDRAFT_42231 [Tremella mesenterica DSM 1558]RXK35305.1 hypothetical protein M231_07444 [Tremella mesenterica]
MSLPLVNWDHALFTDLQHLLSRVLSSPSTSVIRQLYSKLEQAQPWILALTSLPPPSEEAKQAVEKNPLTLPSGSINISGDLLNITNSISSGLSISQLLAAVLTVQAETLRSTYPARSSAEVAVFALHAWLADMLNFLRELLRLTISPSAETTAPFDTLREWVEGILTIKTSLGPGRGDGTMVDQILSQVDVLQDKLNVLLKTPSGNATDYEVLSFRIGAIRSEQNKLVGLLGIIAESGLLGRGHVIKVLKWLKKAEKVDGLVGLVFSALCAAAKPMDTLDINDVRWEATNDWCKDIRFLKLASGLAIQDTWTIPPLKEAVKLTWVMFYLSALRHDPDVAQVGIDPPAAEHFLQEAVFGDAFQLSRQIIIDLRQQRGLEERDEAKEVAEDSLIKIATASDPTNDDFIIAQHQHLVDCLASKKHFLRNLRNKEEDVSIRRSSAATAPTAVFQAYMALAAAVYRSLPPDSAEHLWSNTTFTGAVLDSRSVHPGQAFWDLLVAISTGPASAAKAYERLKETRWQLASLFKFYSHYHDIMPHIFEPIKTNKQTSMDPMSDQDIDNCTGWTRLLVAIVRWSGLARGALLQVKPHPLQMLFDFLNCDIPTHLKAVVLEAATAFCRRTGDSADDEVISRAVEAYERISFVDPNLDVRQMEGSRIPAPIGWIAKMEYSEVDATTYPLTRAYLGFLTALLPNPPVETEFSRSITPRLANSLRRGTFYVLERVLLMPQARRYARDDERWELLDSVFGFMEKALQAFDMTELLTQASSRAISQIATSLSEEPGFTVLLRILSQPEIFAMLVGVIDTLSQQSQSRRTQSTKVLLRVLRILYRVLDIQLVFSDVLLLTLSDPSRISATSFRRPIGLQSLDHHLLNHLSTINAIALLVGDDDLYVSYMATRIISSLAQSPIFSKRDVFRSEYSASLNRLAGILDASDDSIRIAQGFCKRLQGEGEDVTPEEITDIDRRILRGEDTPDDLNDLPLLIRSAILDLLVDGTIIDFAGPNISHFLLGFELRAKEIHLQDPSDPDARLSCLNIILDQLTEGTDMESSAVALIQTHPILAAKSARLLYQLFSHPTTSRSSMSFAMSTAAYASRQLATIPLDCPVNTTENAVGSGVAVTGQSEIPTTADTLVVFLEYQRWILSCVALETFSFDGAGPSSTTVARALFRGLATDAEEDLVDEEARPPLIISLLESIDMTFRETVPENIASARDLTFYKEFDFDRFKRPDAEWFDIPSLKRELYAFRRHFERTGTLTAGPQSQAMGEEAEYILATLSRKNRETDIALAKGELLTAWNETLKVSLAMLFHHVSDEQQDVVLFTLLDVLLSRLTTAQAPGIVDILCESVLVVMSTVVRLLGEMEGINLPVDQLSAVLLGIIEAVTHPGFSEHARGNLYASIGQYLQLLPLASSTPVDDDGASIAPSVLSNFSKETTIPPSALQRATMTVLGTKKDRFIPILCRDAMDDRDVWKTECFSLLAGIVSACQTARDRHVLSPLTSGGYLSLFVRSIKDREMALIDCLGPDPSDFHAYWVFEAKTAFLMTVAGSRKGAEELLDAGIFEVFATCGFIAVQPIADDSMADASATETILRQHRVLILSLQLLARTLSSLAKPQRSGAGHAISFLNAHRESILLLFRENQQYITATGIEECRLLVALINMVIHKVPEDDLRSPSGFGALHLSVLSVAARFFDRQAWFDNLLDGSETQVENQILSLNQVLLSYLCATTKGLRGGTGHPVLVTGVARSGGNATKYISTAPSLPMVVELLGELAEGVQENSTDYESLVERLQEGLGEDDYDKLQTLDISPDEATFENISAAFASRSHLYFNSIESLLLLVWRHLLYYANDARGAPEQVRPDNLSLSLGSFAGQMNSSVGGAATGRVLERVAGTLRGTLERLDYVEVHSDLVRGKTGRGDAYFGMLVRRLRELTAGLLGEEA